MSEKNEELIKRLKEIERKEKVERLNNSDRPKENNQEKSKVKDSIEGIKENKDFEGRVSTGDDD